MSQIGMDALRLGAAVARERMHIPSDGSEPVSSSKGAASSPKSERLIDVAYKLIRRDIVRCVLKPGSEITEAHLTSRYGTGKSAVRSALGQLSKEQLVVPLPRRGYRVSSVTLSGVHDLFFVRTILEPEAARLAVGRVNVQRLRELHEICQNSRVGKKELDDYLQANDDFHACYIDACGNQYLRGILHDVLDQMMRLFYIGAPFWPPSGDSVYQHDKIVAAIAAGDAQAAAAAVREHVDTMREAVIDGIMRMPSIMALNLVPDALEAGGDA